MAGVLLFLVPPFAAEAVHLETMAEVEMTQATVSATDRPITNFRHRVWLGNRVIDAVRLDLDHLAI